MASIAWNDYKRHADFSSKQLTPELSTANIQQGHLLQALPTLWMMNMKEEFEIGKRVIQLGGSLPSRLSQDLTTDQFLTQYVGPLLSCYALSKDRFFFNEALKLVEGPEFGPILNQAYNTTTGMGFLGSLDSQNFNRLKQDWKKRLLIANLCVDMPQALCRLANRATILC